VAVIGIAVAQSKTRECIDFIASLREGQDASVVLHFLGHSPDPAAFARTVALRTPFAVMHVEVAQPMRPRYVYLPVDGALLAVQADGSLRVRPAQSTETFNATTFFSNLARARHPGAVGVLIADGRHEGIPGLHTIVDDAGIAVFSAYSADAWQEQGTTEACNTKAEIVADPAAIAGRVDAFLRSMSGSKRQAEKDAGPVREARLWQELARHAASGKLDVLQQSVVHAIARKLQADAACLFRFDPQAHLFRLEHALPTTQRLEQDVPEDRVDVAWAHQSVSLTTAAASERFSAPFGGVHANLSVLMKDAAGAPVAVLLARVPQQISPLHLAFVQDLSELLRTAMQSAMASHQAPAPSEVRDRVFARYRQITQVCNDAPTVDQAIARVLALLAGDCNGSYARVYLTDPDDPAVLLPGSDLWHLAGPEGDAEQIDVDRQAEQILRQAARRALQSPQLVQQTIQDDTARFSAGAQVLSVALECAGQSAGALVCVFEASAESGLPTGLVEAAACQLALRVLGARVDDRATESRNFMLRLADNVPYLLFVYDLQTARITYANRRIREQLGYDANDISVMGKQQLATLIHPEDLVFVRNDLRKLRRGQADLAAQVELRVLHASGQWRWLHLRRSTFSTTRRGRPRAILITGVDITTSKAASQALNESENRFQAIFNNAALGVALIDTDGRMELVNRAFRQFLGYSGEELYKRSFREITHPANVERDQRLFDELMVGGRRSFAVETRYIRKGGQVVWGHLSASVLRNAEGQPVNVIGVVKDIGERKRLESAFVDFTVLEQRKILQYLHNNLGQQLTGLEMMTRTLQQRLTRRQLPEAVTAEELISWLTEAHNQLRALTAGLRPVEVDAEGFCIAARDLAANTEALTGVRCRVHCETDFVLPDDNTAAHLFYIVQEAVSNAVQHAGATDIIIDLKPQRGQVVLTVEDNGRGLPDEAMALGGTGLRIMAYRAGIVGAMLTLQAGAQGGTLVTCALREEK
jgi:hypothetical protein